MVIDTWRGLEIQGWGAYILQQKLKYLKARLKEWHASKFKTRSMEQQKLVEEMNKLDIMEEERSLLEAEIDRKIEL